MACQPLPEDVASSTPRQQSAPINIEYRDTDQYQYQPRYWQEEHYRWQHRQIEDQEDEDHQYTSDSEWDDVMANGFSGGVIEPPKDEEKSDLPSRECENYINLEQLRPNNEMRRQKIVEMNDDDDLFEKLLAENERKLRQLISYVENVHLVLK